METEQFGFTYGGMDMSIHSHIQMKQQLNKKSAMSLREIREGYLGGYAGRKGEGEIIYYMISKIKELIKILNTYPCFQGNLNLSSFFSPQSHHLLSCF